MMNDGVTLTYMSVKLKIHNSFKAAPFLHICFSIIYATISLSRNSIVRTTLSVQCPFSFQFSQNNGS